eukprot:3760059-Pyramimonas_sp.AAC.1
MAPEGGWRGLGEEKLEPTLSPDPGIAYKGPVRLLGQAEHAPYDPEALLGPAGVLGGVLIVLLTYVEGP